MEREELDKHWLPASWAAEAMKVSNKSIHLWFAANELEGDQTTTGRLWVTAASCRALIRKRRGVVDSSAEEYFDQYLRNKEKMPISPFSMPRVKPADQRVMVCS